MSPLDRRRFLALASSAAFCGASSQGQQQAAAPAHDLHFTQARTGVGPFRQRAGAERPHLFLISADMVSPDLYHPDRSLAPHLHLPHLRALMADGTFFSNAFCTVPLCAPSRASYLTGRYSYIQGNGERAPEGLESQLRPDDTIFPEYLRAAGYVARQAGKAHVGTKKFLDAFSENDQPWDRWSPPVFDDDDFLAYQQRLGVKPQKYSREIVFLQQDRVTPGNSAGGWVEQEDGRPFPIEAQYSYYLGQRAIADLRALSETGVLQKHPVYLQIDLFDPHQPFSIPSGFEERERELRRIMTLPASYETAKRRNFARDASEPEIINIYQRYWGLYEPQKVLDYRVAYALQMELVDRVLGTVLDEIRRLGLYEQSAIAFISDHGEMNGRHALVDKGVYLYPDTVRVPFIIKPANGVPGRANTVPEPVSLLDLSQTMLDMAGIEPAAKFDGISLVPALHGNAVHHDEALLFFGGWHVGVNFACGLAHRTPDGHDYLYAYNCTSPVDQLYDLRAEDAVNLAADERYRPILEACIRRLGAALQTDPRWVGFWAEFRIARYEALPHSSGDMQLFAKPS